MKRGFTIFINGIHSALGRQQVNNARVLTFLRHKMKRRPPAVAKRIWFRIIIQEILNNLQPTPQRSHMKWRIVLLVARLQISAPTKQVAHNSRHNFLILPASSSHMQRGLTVTIRNIRIRPCLQQLIDNSDVLIILSRQVKRRAIIPVTHILYVHLSHQNANHFRVLVTSCGLMKRNFFIFVANSRVRSVRQQMLNNSQVLVSPSRPMKRCLAAFILGVGIRPVFQQGFDYLGGIAIFGSPMKRGLFVVIPGIDLQTIFHQLPDNVRIFRVPSSLMKRGFAALFITVLDTFQHLILHVHLHIRNNVRSPEERIVVHVRTLQSRGILRLRTGSQNANRNNAKRALHDERNRRTNSARRFRQTISASWESSAQREAAPDQLILTTEVGPLIHWRHRKLHLFARFPVRPAGQNV